LEDLGLDGNNIRPNLKYIVWGSGLHSYGLEYSPVAGSAQHGNEPSGSTKEREFLD